MEDTENNLDVKPVAESSPATTTTEAPATSAVTLDGKPTGITATEAKTEAKPSLDEVLAAKAKELLQPESPPDSKAEEKTEDAPQSEEQKTEETKEAEAPKAEEAKKEDETTKPIPYERFKEVNEKAQKFERELADEKPWADAQRSIVKHLTEHNISQDKFFYWMDVAAKIESDPAKALELLAPVVKQLGEYSGDTLSPEHQKMLDDGIPKEIVLRLAKAEGKAKAEARSRELTQKQQQDLAIKAQVNQFVADAKTQLDAFIQGKKSDVDFTPKKNGEPDGKFELFMREVDLAVRSGAVKQPADIANVAKQAYDNVTATLSRYAPKPKVNGKHVSSTKSNGTSTNGAPKNLDEAMQRMLKSKHGLDWRIPVRK